MMIVDEIDIKMLLRENKFIIGGRCKRIINVRNNSITINTLTSNIT